MVTDDYRVLKRLTVILVTNSFIGDHVFRDTTASIFPFLSGVYLISSYNFPSILYRKLIFFLEIQFMIITRET